MLYSTHPKGLQNVYDIERDGHFPGELKAYPPSPHPPVPMLCPLTSKAFSMSVILTAMGWCGCLPVEFEAYPPPTHTCAHAVSTHLKGIQHVCDIDSDCRVQSLLPPPPPPPPAHKPMQCPLTSKASSMSMILTAIGWCRCLPVEFEAPPPSPPPLNTGAHAVSTHLKGDQHVYNTESDGLV